MFALFAAACLLSVHGVGAHGAHGHGHGVGAHGSHGHGHRHRAPAPAVRASASAPPELLARPLRMDRVTLQPGSRFDEQRARNLDYLLAMNATDLYCEYTSAANLTGTWDRPTCVKKDNNGYWGHYAGHYVSATAQLCNATGDAGACARNAEVVATLARVQAAWTARPEPEYEGFLFPYSIVAWTNLFGPPSRNCAPVCVPFYVLHKALAGLLDAHELAGSAQALDVALALAGWVRRSVEGVLAAPDGVYNWQSVLDTEWGGMNDALFRLYALTGDGTWQTVAYYFNHWSWTAPLAAGVDDLPGNHANTHIPEVIGDALGYELTGNATKSAIVTTFFAAQTQHHAFSTGNGNDGEHWGAADAMGDQLNADTEESCTSYNLIKVSRHLFGWSLDTALLDHYERVLYNGLIGNQARTGPFSPDAHTTGFIYMLPLGGGGLTKPWGVSDEGLPCCWGTLSETFAKISDSIFYEGTAAGDDTLYVALFAPATVAWRAGAVVRQDSGYPYASRYTTALTVVAPGASASFALAIRVPAWATSGANTVTLNGAPVPGPVAPGSFFKVKRTWAANDVLSAHFPPALSFEALNDARANFAGVGALLYGGVLLAAVNTTSDAFPVDTSPAGLARALTRVPPAPPAGGDYADLVFAGASDGCGNATFIPLADVVFERYAAYLHTASGDPAQPVGYNASGFSVLGGGADGFVTGGGASITPNGGDENVRSGDPGEVTSAAYVETLLDASHVVTGISFSYQYVAGYGADGAPGGTTFDVVAVEAGACGAGGAVLATLYSSPVLSHYPFDKCNTCYSPPVNVNVPRGSVALNVTGGVDIVFRFTNNERNVQLKLPIPATVYWG